MSYRLRDLGGGPADAGRLVMGEELRQRAWKGIEGDYQVTEHLPNKWHGYQNRRGVGSTYA